MNRISIVFAGLLAAGTALADEEVSKHRTELFATGGFSVGSSGPSVRPALPFGRFGFGGSQGGDAGVAVGGGIAHDFTPRLTLEASAVYQDRGARAEALSAEAGFRLNLRPSGQAIVPYLAASGGVYRVSIDAPALQQPVLRLPVVMATVGPPRMGRGPGVVATPLQPQRGGGVAQPQRTGAEVVERDRTDPLVSLGGGVRFDAGSHVFVRPDVRAQIVLSGDTRVFGLFALNFGYRF